MAEHLLGLPIKHKFKDIKKRDHALLTNVLPDQHHRQWNLFDEPSWIRTLYLPLGTWTKVGVVLIGLTDWHPDWAGHPRPIYNEADRKYWVYFAGGNVDRAIGLATGTSLKAALDEITDGIDGTSKVLRKGTGFEATGVSFPTVIYDPLEPDAAKRWKMMYTGRDATNIYRDIGYAYSADGKSWTKYPGNPVIDVADRVQGPSLMRLGNKFYCVVENVTDKTMELFYSDDCISWTYWGVILRTGAAGEWDDTLVQYPTLYFDQGTFYMVYTGYDGTIRRMGLAITQKWFETWFKLPYNPILEDTVDVATGCLIRMEDEFLMVYQRGATWDIRSATIP